VANGKKVGYLLRREGNKGIEEACLLFAVLKALSCADTPWEKKSGIIE